MLESDPVMPAVLGLARDAQHFWEQGIPPVQAQCFQDLPALSEPSFPWKGGVMEVRVPAFLCMWHVANNDSGVRGSEAQIPFTAPHLHVARA